MRTFPLSSLGSPLAFAPRAQRNLTFGQKIKNKQTNKKQLRPAKINIRTIDKNINPKSALANWMPPLPTEKPKAAPITFD